MYKLEVRHLCALIPVYLRVHAHRNGRGYPVTSPQGRVLVCPAVRLLYVCLIDTKPHYLRTVALIVLPLTAASSVSVRLESVCTQFQWESNPMDIVLTRLHWSINCNFHVSFKFQRIDVEIYSCSCT